MATGAISSQGLGSGLDIASIVSKLMTIEQLPLTKLQTQEASYQAQLTAYGAVKSALSSLQADAAALSQPGSFSTTNASSSDATVATANSSGSATAGNYNLAVLQLAKASQIRATAASGAVFNAGTLQIQINSQTTDVAITAGATLAQIRDAINNSGAAVTASIINTGTGAGDSLVLLSNVTGSSGAVSLTATDSGGGATALTTLESTITDQAAQDAFFYVNGTLFSRTSNMVTDAIAGVTINLQKGDTTPVSLPYTNAPPARPPVSPPTPPASAPATAPTTTLTVTQSNSSASTLINNFVKDYNALIQLLNKDTAYDAQTNTPSVFTGDNTVQSIRTQLSRALFTTVAGMDSITTTDPVTRITSFSLKTKNLGISGLNELGISVNKDGSLAVNSGKLNAVLADSSKDVKSLFTQSTPGYLGIGATFKSILDGMLGSSGALTARTDGINASITYSQKQQAVLKLRLAKIQDNYNAKFNAMDGLVGQMKNLQSQLTAQLAALPGFITNSNKKIN